MTAVLRRAAPWLLIAALATVVIFARLPAGPRYLYVIHKLGHPLAFGLIAWIIHRQRRRDAPYLTTLLLAVLLGGATELAQIPVHRDASWLDVARDGSGAIAALALLASARQRGRWPALIAAVALCAIAAPLLWCAAAYAHRALQFPVIAQFRSPLDQYFVDRNDGKSLVLHEPAPDWSRYHVLAVDLTNPNDTPLPVVVRVHDRRHNWEHNDRYNGRFVLPAHARQVLHIPLSEIAAAPRGRRLDLQQIRGVAVFVPNTARPEPFTINRLWLEAGS